MVRSGQSDVQPIRTGLLGGSFNPAHGGHRNISRVAQRALGLDQIWWLVSPGNPLKPQKDMAPITQRMRSATKQAKGLPILVSGIERNLGTQYTADSMKKLVRRFPKREFIWLMGADNLAQFHRWKNWRSIAKLMPIAVISRPGYDGSAGASPAMAWLRHYRKPITSFTNGNNRNTPALTFIRFNRDIRSATAIRAANSKWTKLYAAAPLRDPVTRRFIREQNA